MKVGVLSDTHDRLPTFERAVALFRRLNVGAILHAGDFIAPFAARLIGPEADLPMPVHAVYGNNDGEKAGLKNVLPQVVDGPLRITVGQGGETRTVVMHHFIDWLKPQDLAGADVVITGHTHEVVIEDKGGQLLLNPGECCGWVTGRCTVALLDLATLEAQIIDVHA